jgi:hypothetical protein
VADGRGPAQNEPMQRPIEWLDEAPSAPDPGVVAVVRAAAGLLTRYAAVIERCRTEYDPGPAPAREAGALVREFERLRATLEDRLEEPLAARVDQILRLHARVLREASQLAYRPRGPHWPRLVRCFGDGLTDASDDLLRLAAELPAAAAGPGG